MKKYIEYLKKSFAPLELNNESSLSDKRASHPLELFFDLVFVVALGKVGHVFLHPKPNEVIMAIILFLAVFQVWKNITRFNVYFFKQSLVCIFLFLIVMLPIFFIASISNYENPNNIYLLIVSFIVSRFVLAFAWYKLVYKNSNIANLYINKIAKYYSKIFLISSLVMLLSLLYYQLFYIVLLLTVFLEFVFISLMPKKVAKYEELKRPHIDLELLQERRVLFVILVWGEALVTAGSVFSQYNNFMDALCMSLALFFIIGLFFIRALASFGDTYNVRHMHSKILELTDYTFPLITLSLFVSVAGIASTEHINNLSRFIVIIDLIYINTSHFIANISERRKTEDINRVYFVKVDNVFLTLQFVVTALLIFIDSPNIFVYSILIIFIFHAIAVPIRYNKTEYF